MTNALARPAPAEFTASAPRVAAGLLTGIETAIALLAGPAGEGDERVLAALEALEDARAEAVPPEIVTS